MTKANLPELGKKRIVVIGGGFAGLSIAKKLVKLDYQVVLLDKNNYHQFQPLLYQVATGGLEPGAIAHPIRKIFSNKNIYIRLAEVLKVNTQSNVLETTIGDIKYDYLVIATGATTNYFGNKELESNCIGMKTVPEALDIRSLVLQNVEQAVLCDNDAEKDALLNIVVVGAGPTGVEVAGALSEMKRYVLPNDFPELDFSLMDIYVIESNDRVLGPMSPESSKKAHKYLVDMGVHVQVGVRVTAYDGNTVTMSNGATVQTKTVVWAAGIKGNTLEGIDTGSVARGFRYQCDEFNLVKGYSNIFAIGDISLITTEQEPNGHPQLATVAMQQGAHLAKNFKNLSAGKPLEKFKYFNKGTMATVGRNKAVVELPFFKFGGYFAWLVWMFVHLMSLVGFRNRVSVFVTWCYNYFRYEQALRLIIRPYEKKK